MPGDSEVPLLTHTAFGLAVSSVHPAQDVANTTDSPFCRKAAAQSCALHQLGLGAFRKVSVVLPERRVSSRRRVLPSKQVET